MPIRWCWNVKEFSRYEFHLHGRVDAGETFHADGPSDRDLGYRTIMVVESLLQRAREMPVHRSVVGTGAATGGRTGIVDTACLLCVAGSDGWEHCKKVLRDCRLHHVIEETCEAERCKFDDGGALLATAKAAAPSWLQGTRARLCSTWFPHVVFRWLLAEIS